MENKQEIIQKIFDKVKKERELFEEGLTSEEIEEKEMSNIDEEVLFMVRKKLKNGEIKIWKIFVGGKIEGFGENCGICNNFNWIFCKLHNYFLREKKS